MNVVSAPAIPTDCTLPDWLCACLLDQQKIASGEPIPEAVAGDRSNSELVCKAFDFAYRLHQGQNRASGEAYICHPVAVAGILRDLGGDSAMIAAGFLHDVVEDTVVTLEELRPTLVRKCACWLKASPSSRSLIFIAKLSVRPKTFAACFWRWPRIFA